MAISKEQKVAIVERLSDDLGNAQAITFAWFSGLNVEDTTQLRSDLRDQGVGYRVVKKTLLRRVLDSVNPAGTMPALEGNIAVAWSPEDPTAPARLIYKFAKDHEDTLKIVGGVYEGAYMDAIAMNEIAMIPSQEVLLGMFVNVINAPIQGFVSVLGQIAEKKA